MNRREFLKNVGLGAAAFAASEAVQRRCFRIKVCRCRWKRN